jgi:AcrR family transcriptional regulator
MVEIVKSRRAYNADGRRAQGSATRLAVLEAARELFLANGYARTSIPAVARAASVSPELIYKRFGPKPALLKAVFDVSVAGDDDPVTLEDRDLIKQLQADHDGAHIIATYAAFYARTQARTAPILLLARQAAAADPQAAEVWDQMNAERLTGMTHFAADLHRKRLLRKGVPARKARDILWAYTSVELYELLVIRQEWTIRMFREFMTQALSAALLDD